MTGFAIILFPVQPLSATRSVFPASDQLQSLSHDRRHARPASFPLPTHPSTSASPALHCERLTKIIMNLIEDASNSTGFAVGFT